MIKRSHFKTIWRLPAFIFLFWVMIMCTINPCRVFALDSTTSESNEAKEEIATFDEDEETVFESEHAAKHSSSSLHAEHYQPPVYFPERQKRYLTSHVWMRIIPFAMLVILAIATTRLFGRRRQKNISEGDATASGKIIIGIGIFLAVMTTAGVAKAQITYPVKDAVVAFLGEGREIFQKDIELTKDMKKILKEKLWWEPRENSIKVYYSKTKDGAVEAYAFVLSDTLMKCNGRHRYCIKVSSTGQVEGVKILELNCPYSFAINNERFLNRLKILNTMNAGKTSIDAVTSATISSKLSVMVVRRALLLFELIKGKVNE